MDALHRPLLVRLVDYLVDRAAELIGLRQRISDASLDPFHHLSDGVGIIDIRVSCAQQRGCAMPGQTIDRSTTLVDSIQQGES